MELERVSMLEYNLKYGPGYIRRLKYFYRCQDFFWFVGPIKLFADSLQYFGCELGDYESFTDRVYSPRDCDCVTYFLNFLYKGYACRIGVTVRNYKSIVRVYFPEIRTDENYKLLYEFTKSLTYNKDIPLLAGEIVEALNLYLN